MKDQDTRERIQRIEALLHTFEESHDPKARADAAELIHALMDIHGACLDRIVTVLANYGETGQEILAKLGTDEAVSGLLILYGLHPVALAERIHGAIKNLQPLLQSHQAGLELVSIDKESVRVRLVANGSACHSNAGQLKQTVADAIIGAAPDIEEITIEEVGPEQKPVFVTLQRLKKTDSTDSSERFAVV